MSKKLCLPTDLGVHAIQSCRIQLLLKAEILLHRKPRLRGVFVGRGVEDFHGGASIGAQHAGGRRLALGIVCCLHHHALA